MLQTSKLGPGTEKEVAGDFGLVYLAYSELFDLVIVRAFQRTESGTSRRGERP